MGEAAGLDRCCLALWSCDHIPPLAFQMNTFNPHHFPLFPCSCAQQFLSCLAGEAGREAARLARVWGGAHCYTLHQQTDCQQWDTWFGSCLQGNTTTVATQHLVSTFSTAE